MSGNHNVQRKHSFVSIIVIQLDPDYLNLFCSLIITASSQFILRREVYLYSLIVSDLYKDFPKLFFVTHKNTLLRINYILSA